MPSNPKIEAIREKKVIECEHCKETRACITWWNTPYGKFRLCEKCSEIPLENIIHPIK